MEYSIVDFFDLSPFFPASLLQSEQIKHKHVCALNALSY